MNEENRITLILIDTCAFRDANSDFPGIAKSLLPSFFSTADEKGITLLTHPVLENEIHKHIEDSGIFKDYQSLLTQLRKCTSTLKHYKLDDVLLSSKISELDIQTKLFEAYQQYYQDAIRLDFGDPASVFELYFNSKAPFAMPGKKKAEFPDAFVFDATRKYLEKHPNDILLVISKDSDWTTAFNQIENVIICDSISNALTKISNIDSILSQEMLSQIFRGAYKEIISNAQQNVECECFELDDYTVMGFDCYRQDWNTVDFCPTPEDLLDSLLDAYENFRMMEITGGDRDLTEKEEAKLAKERDALTALCEKEAAKCSS